jgi:mono/diheme cytochrome c family protein
MLKTCVFFLLVLLFFLLSGCNSSERNDLPVPPAGFFGNPEQITVGRLLFVAHCTECHGTLAEGRNQRAARFKPAAPDFQELRYRTVLPGYLYLRIAHGRKMEPFRSAGSVMPPWSAYLKEEQIWALVAFIHERAGGSISR